MEGRRDSSDTAASNQHKKIKTANHLEIPDLPEKIIHDILLRLPVKSLLKFRGVSKLWLWLICSPRFVKAHLKFSSRISDFSNHGIMFTFTPHDELDNDFDLKQCSVSSLMFGRPAVSSIDYPNKSSCTAVSVVGSCNGIICINIDKRYIFLWNPSTRKSKALPHVDLGKKGFYYTWGFGCSDFEHDYKVVCIFLADGNGLLDEWKVKIYSLRTDSWKSTEDFRYGIPHSPMGIFASGKLYFRAFPHKLGTKKIVSLDLKSECYAIVEGPKYGDVCSYSHLGLLGGCLSFLCNYQRTRDDVWILREHDFKESWTRVISIPYLNCSVRYSSLDPLLIMPNGEIVLIHNSSLTIYNPKDNSFTHHCISTFHGFLKANIYVESLVSL